MNLLWLKVIYMRFIKILFNFVNGFISIHAIPWTDTIIAILRSSSIAKFVLFHRKSILFWNNLLELYAVCIAHSAKPTVFSGPQRFQICNGRIKIIISHRCWVIFGNILQIYHVLQYALFSHTLILWETLWSWSIWFVNLIDWRMEIILFWTSWTFAHFWRTCRILSWNLLNSFRLAFFWSMNILKIFRLVSEVIETKKFASFFLNFKTIWSPSIIWREVLMTRFCV